MYTLVIKFNLPGIHKWPDAPKKYSYLSQYHRHQFYWKICIAIDNRSDNCDNRHLEIIELQQSCITALEGHFKRFVKTCNIELLDFKDMSCEQIAFKTYKLVSEILHTGEPFDAKVSQVRVLEDNENGATYHGAS